MEQERIHHHRLKVTYGVERAPVHIHLSILHKLFPNFLFVSKCLSINQSSTEHYVKDVFQWMVPFLHRCERQKEGAAKSLLGEYLVSLAQRDLSLPLIIFQHSKPDVRIRTHTSTLAGIGKGWGWGRVSHLATHKWRDRKMKAHSQASCWAVCAMSGPLS